MSGRNLTAKRLAELDEHISEIDRQILHDVARFRLVTGEQLGRIHLDELSGRSTRRILNRLTEEQVLARLDRRIGGARAGSAGFVYKLGSAGARLVEVSVGKRTWQPSTLFLRHTLAITERYVELVERSDLDVWRLLTFEAEPDCWRRFTGSSGMALTLKPDGYFVLASERYEDHWFLEVDLATESLTAVRRKASRYAEYYASGMEQNRLGVFPRVWWWSPRPERQAALRRTLVDVEMAEMHMVLTDVRDLWSPEEELTS